MKKEDKKNLLVVAFFALLIIAIIIAIIIDVLPRNFFNQRRSEEVILEEYVSDKAVPQGIYVLTQNYNGEIDKNEFYRKFNEISQYNIELYKELQKKDVEKYYNKNERKVFEILGIENFEDFEKVTNIIKNKNLKDTKFKYCAIEKTSFSKEQYYTCLNLEFYYENNEIIKFKIKLLNKMIGIKPLVVVGNP